MYTLSNEQLQVEILDPLADQLRFGTRYCTGGYIFQITDRQRGPLLSGPTYPDDFTWFHGQGIPDAFNLHPLQDPAAGGAAALVIGVGTCDLQQNKVLEFCAWECTPEADQLAMRTTQAFQDFALELERSVRLSGRSVRSTTRLKNTGKRPLPICWFPHPFYPQPDTPELFRVNIAIQMAENPGYSIAENGFVTRKAWPPEHGHYQALDHTAQDRLVVLQRHPLLGLVAATCSYAPTFFPIWGNEHTFSWEPFFERTLAWGQETTWWVEYDF